MVEANIQSGGRPKLPMQGVPQPGREEVLHLPRVHISTHPVMRHKMTALRDGLVGGHSRGAAQAVVAIDAFLVIVEAGHAEFFRRGHVQCRLPARRAGGVSPLIR